MCVLIEKQTKVATRPGDGSVGKGATKPDDDLSSNPRTYKIGENRLLKVDL